MGQSNPIVWFELQQAPFDLRLAIIPGQPILFGHGGDGKDGPGVWLIRPKEFPGAANTVAAGVAGLINAHQILTLPPNASELAFDPDALKTPSLHVRVGWKDGKRWASFYSQQAIPEKLTDFARGCRELGMDKIATIPGRTLTPEEALREVQHQPRTETHQVQTIRFVCEQDGEIERNLKGELNQCFTASPVVTSAYLAWVQYPPSGELHVALCLRLKDGAAPDAIVAEASRCFASHFGADQHLDTLALTPEQEKTLQGVCQAFFP